MTVLPLLAVGILMKFVAVLFVLVCLVLILVVLMQKGRGGGLSGAFGGGMASGLLGSKTGDFLTWVTIVLVSVFLFLAVLMARYYKPTTQYGNTVPPATQQPAVPAGQPAAPSPGASGQPAPVAPAPTPQPEATQPATPPSTEAPGTSGTEAPAGDTGKNN
jgi:preprotein translocase subunit SecG